jgi:hypothetical protein
MLVIDASATLYLPASEDGIEPFAEFGWPRRHSCGQRSPPS